MPFGVVAGNRSHTSLLGDAPSDGVVLLENTRLEGMADWVEVEHTHTFMMNSAGTFECVLNFLRTGRFRAGEGTGGAKRPCAS